MKKLTLLFILIVISSVFRFYNLDNRGVFTDEKFTLLNANGIWVGAANQPEILNQKYFTATDFWVPKSFNDYLESIAHSDFGTHIVYNGIVHFWMEAFGNTDFSIRFLSALFSLVTVVLIYIFTLKIFKSHTAAFLAGFLLAVDPLNIALSHIARSYTLSFLLVLLSTYYFVKIVGKEKGSKKTMLFLVYTILIGLGLLNHYLNFLVPLCHAILFLFIKNKKHLWIGFICAGFFNIFLMVYWFNWGGGYTAMDFLKDKNQKHLQLAKMSNGQLNDVIQLSTKENVTKKTIVLFFDSSVVTQGLYSQLKGVKNVFVTLLVFMAFLVAYFYRNNIKIAGPILLLVLILLIYFHSIALGLLIACFYYFSIFFGIEYGVSLWRKNDSNQKVVLLFCGVLMLFIPIFFVVNDALKNGHTTSLTHRYIGISSPFVSIFLGLGISKFLEFSKYIYVWLVLVFIIQFSAVKKEIKDYFEDKSSLNAWFDPARVKNPYSTTAEKIKAYSALGDTLLIPGAFQDIYAQTFDTKKRISYLDAQFLNLYLPKDSKLPQRLDTFEKDKVFLKKKSGEKILLFDFEGTKYRY